MSSRDKHLYTYNSIFPSFELPEDFTIIDIAKNVLKYNLCYGGSGDLSEIIMSYEEAKYHCCPFTEQQRLILKDIAEAKINIGYIIDYSNITDDMLNNGYTQFVEVFFYE